MKYKIKIRIYSPGGRGKETTKIVLEKAKTSDLLDLLSHVRLFSTSWTVACQAPLSMGTLQARILEWIAVPSSRGSSPASDGTCISYVSCIGRQVLLPLVPPEE